MKKLLFVTYTSDQKFTGGLQCSKRNLESLQAILGKDNVIVYTISKYSMENPISSIIKRIKDILGGYMGGLDYNQVKLIMQLIAENGITDIFIDSSLLGNLAKIVKRKYPEIVICTFFHNFEKKFIKDYLRVKKDYIRFYWYILAGNNEYNAVKYSDKIICLNPRDSDDIFHAYRRVADSIIPITLKDSVKVPEDFLESDNRNALFIGSYFFGNVQGIKWFCENVLPNTDITLTIVGASMDKFRDEVRCNPNLMIYSDVEDLTPYYNNADFVVLPILSGSGMKVKTAESLMHGKYIIGTDEAFRGYEITNFEGKVCNSAEEFIQAINSLDLKYKFNKASRSLFNDKYCLYNRPR